MFGNTDPYGVSVPGNFSTKEAAVSELCALFQNESNADWPSTKVKLETISRRCFDYLIECGTINQVVERFVNDIIDVAGRRNPGNVSVLPKTVGNLINFSILSCLGFNTTESYNASLRSIESMCQRPALAASRVPYGGPSTNIVGSVVRPSNIPSNNLPPPLPHQQQPFLNGRQKIERQSLYRQPPVERSQPYGARSQMDNRLGPNSFSDQQPNVYGPLGDFFVLFFFSSFQPSRIVSPSSWIMIYLVFLWRIGIGTL